MEPNKKLNLRLLGVELLPLDYYQGDARTVRHLLETVETDAKLSLEQLPAPKLLIRIIFTDDQGDHYIVLPAPEESPIALPYITGSDLDIDNGNFSQGGFIPSAMLPEFQFPPRLAPASVHNEAGVVASRVLAGDVSLMPEQEQTALPSESSKSPINPALWGKLAQLAVSSSAQGGDALVGGMLDLVQGQIDGLLQSHLPKELSGVAGAGLDYLMKEAQQQLMGLMSDQDGAGGLGGIVPNGLVAPQEENSTFDGLAQSAGTMAVDKLIGMGFDAITEDWKVDDNSSTLEHVAHQYGKQALAMIQDYIKKQLKESLGLSSVKDKLGNESGGLLKKLDEFFNGIKPTPAIVATATLPAAHIAAKDDKVDIVVSGQGNVLVGGKPIARITDVLMPSNMIILQGSATVLAGGLPVSRLTAKTAVPSVILTGVPSVLIGGPSVSIPAPVVSKPAAPVVAGVVGASSGNSGRSIGGKGEGSGKEEKERSGSKSEKQENDQKGKNFPQDKASAEKRREEIRQQLNRGDLTDDQHQSLLDEYYELDKRFPGRDDGETLPEHEDEKPKSPVKFTLPDDIKKKLEEFGGDRKKQIEFLNDTAARIGGLSDLASEAPLMGDITKEQLKLLKLNLRLTAAALEENPEVALAKTDAILSGEIAGRVTEKVVAVLGPLGYIAKNPVSSGVEQLTEIFVEGVHKNGILGGPKEIGNNIANDFSKVYDSWKAVYNMYLGMYLGKKD